MTSNQDPLKTGAIFQMRDGASFRSPVPQLGPAGGLLRPNARLNQPFSPPVAGPTSTEDPIRQSPLPRVAGLSTPTRAMLPPPPHPPSGRKPSGPGSVVRAIAHPSPFANSFMSPKRTGVTVSPAPKSVSPAPLGPSSSRTEEQNNGTLSRDDTNTTALSSTSTATTGKRKAAEAENVAVSTSTGSLDAMSSQDLFSQEVGTQVEPIIPPHPITAGEKAPTYLHKWWPQYMLTSPDVSVWGMDAPQSQRFHSSRIVERVDKTTLKTKSGSIYILVGEINAIDAKGASMPEGIIKKFRNGFPADWKDVLLTEYTKIPSSSSRAVNQRVAREASSTKAIVDKLVDEILGEVSEPNPAPSSSNRSARKSNDDDENEPEIEIAEDEARTSKKAGVSRQRNSVESEEPDYDDDDDDDDDHDHDGDDEEEEEEVEEVEEEEEVEEVEEEEEEEVSLEDTPTMRKSMTRRTSASNSRTPQLNYDVDAMDMDVVPKPSDTRLSNVKSKSSASISSARDKRKVQEQEEEDEEVDEVDEEDEEIIPARPSSILKPLSKQLQSKSPTPLAKRPSVKKAAASSKYDVDELDEDKDEEELNDSEGEDGDEEEVNSEEGVISKQRQVKQTSSKKPVATPNKSTKYNHRSNSSQSTTRPKMVRELRYIAQSSQSTKPPKGPIAGNSLGLVSANKVTKIAPTSRSGRTLLKPMAYWANETIFRDGFGNAISYLPGSPATVTRRTPSKSSPNSRTPQTNKQAPRTPASQTPDSREKSTPSTPRHEMRVSDDEEDDEIEYPKTPTRLRPSAPASSNASTNKSVAKLGAPQQQRNNSTASTPSRLARALRAPEDVEVEDELEASNSLEIYGEDDDDDGMGIADNNIDQDEDDDMFDTPILPSNSSPKMTQPQPTANTAAAAEKSTTTAKKSKAAPATKATNVHGAPDSRSESEKENENENENKSESEGEREGEDQPSGSQWVPQSKATSKSVESDDVTLGSVRASGSNQANKPTANDHARKEKVADLRASQSKHTRPVVEQITVSEPEGEDTEVGSSRMKQPAKPATTTKLTIAKKIVAKVVEAPEPEGEAMPAGSQRTARSKATKSSESDGEKVPERDSKRASRSKTNKSVAIVSDSDGEGLISQRASRSRSRPSTSPVRFPSPPRSPPHRPRAKAAAAVIPSSISSKSSEEPEVEEHEDEDERSRSRGKQVAQKPSAKKSSGNASKKLSVAARSPSPPSTPLQSPQHALDGDDDNNGSHASLSPPFSPDAHNTSNNIDGEVGPMENTQTQQSQSQQSQQELPKKPTTPKTKRPPKDEIALLNDYFQTKSTPTAPRERKAPERLTQEKVRSYVVPNSPPLSPRPSSRSASSSSNSKKRKDPEPTPVKEPIKPRTTGRPTRSTPVVEELDEELTTHAPPTKKLSSAGASSSSKNAATSSSSKSNKKKRSRSAEEDDNDVSLASIASQPPPSAGRTSRSKSGSSNTSTTSGTSKKPLSTSKTRTTSAAKRRKQAEEDFEPDVEDDPTTPQKPSKQNKGKKAGKKAAASADGNDESEWSRSQTLALRTAYKTVNPTVQGGFWEAVAKLIPGKTPAECSAKWNEKYTTPKEKKAKKKTTVESSPLALDANMKTQKDRRKLREALQRADNDHEDDAFDSTPFKQRYGKRPTSPLIAEEAQPQEEAQPSNASDAIEHSIPQESQAESEQLSFPMEGVENHIHDPHDVLDHQQFDYEPAIDNQFEEVGGGEYEDPQHYAAVIGQEADYANSEAQAAEPEPEPERIPAPTRAAPIADDEQDIVEDLLQQDDYVSELRRVDRNKLDSYTSRYHKASRVGTISAQPRHAAPPARPAPKPQQLDRSAAVMLIQQLENTTKKRATREDDLLDSDNDAGFDGLASLSDDDLF